MSPAAKRQYLVSVETRMTYWTSVTAGSEQEAIAKTKTLFVAIVKDKTLFNWRESNEFLSDDVIEMFWTAESAGQEVGS